MKRLLLSIDVVFASSMLIGQTMDDYMEVQRILNGKKAVRYMQLEK